MQGRSRGPVHVDRQPLAINEMTDLLGPQEVARKPAAAARRARTRR